MPTEATGFVLLFNRWAALGLFALLGLFVGLFLAGGTKRPERLPAGQEHTPEWARPVNPTRTPTLVIAALIGGLGLGTLAAWGLGLLIGLGLGLIGAIMLPLALNGRGRKKWVEAIEEETLSMLQLLILKLQSGQSLIPALEDIAHNSLRGPLKREIQEFLVGQVTGGASVTQVLAHLRDSPRYTQTWRYQRVLRHLTTSARAQMSAVKIADRMGVLQESLVDTYSLQLELEAELAQAKYSRWIVTGTLPLTVGAFFLFAPDIAVNLIDSIPGQITLVAVTGMMVMLHTVGGKVAQLPPLEL